MLHRIGIAVAVLVAFTLASQAQVGKGKGKSVFPDREWGAVVKDDKLAKEAPKSGVIVDTKAFGKLWKVWRPDEKVPEIDFSKKLVVIGTSLGGPNRPRLSATLDDEGNLKTQYLSTLIGGPGFGYSLAEFERKGIKTINGKPIPKD